MRSGQWQCQSQEKQAQGSGKLEKYGEMVFVLSYDDYTSLLVAHCWGRWKNFNIESIVSVIVCVIIRIVFHVMSQQWWFVDYQILSWKSSIHPNVWMLIHGISSLHISQSSISLVLMPREPVMMIILVSAMEPTTLKRNLMEYDSDGHAGFLERIFRAAMIRNRAGMPTANT